MYNKWWHETVFYQVYPRSFVDTNGDGIGDIKGIISKLPYLKQLGVGAIWFSPLYPSPNFDMGYDISDYKNIHPDYGTLEDMKELISEAERHGIKVTMDLVINHTSFAHKWFQESKNIDSPYHDYYFWRKGTTTKSGKRKAPNNWQSMFTGSAWEYEESNDMFYLHLFTKEQPDLNFSNPKVIEEIKDVLRFWLDLGVAGFRCDVINCISKASLDNGRPRVYKTGLEHYLNTPGCHLILRELYEEVLAPYNAYTVGETTDITIEEAKEFLDKQLTQIFAFDQIHVDNFILPILKKKYKPANMIKALKKWQNTIDWNTLFYENHDVPRSVSRFGSQKFYQKSATALGASILFLKGTPFIYQGQEIGMTNTPFRKLDDFKDVSTINVYKLLRKLLIPHKLAWKIIMFFSRDHGRTPMQWDDSKHGGFTSGEPWLMVNPNFRSINVAAQEEDEKSILSHYRRMIKIRQSSNTFKKGSIEFVKSHREILAFTRSLNGRETYLVLINMGKKSRTHGLDLSGEVVYTNYLEPLLNHPRIRPFEVLVIKKG